jgi:hypothetical protein
LGGEVAVSRSISRGGERDVAAPRQSAGGVQSARVLRERGYRQSSHVCPLAV